MKAGRRQWIGLAVLALPGLLVTMDLTVLFLAVPQLTADLAPSSTQLLWISDVYGFLVAGSLIVARGLQGIAGAALLPSMMALVYTMFADEKQRQAALGAMMGIFALGAALGPLLGGGLLELFDWRPVFLPNVPVIVLLLVVGPRFVEEFRNPEAGRVDLASAALSVGGIIAAVYAVKNVAVDGFEPFTTACAVAGAALLVAFVARQLRIPNPLVDVRMFAGSAFSTALAATTLAMFVTYGTIFFTSQYLQLVTGLSPLEAGLWGLPPMAAMMVMSAAVVPRLAAKLRPVAARGFAANGGH